MSELDFDPIARARDNWVAHGWDEPDVMAAVTSVMRVHQLLIAAINGMLQPLDLTFARYELLVLLTFSRAGALPLGKIGQRLQVHAASVTNAVDRLERSGYVQRRPHPSDGRTTLAVLTPAGREVVAQATATLAAARFGADGLDDDAARALVALLTPLRAAAGDLP